VCVCEYVIVRMCVCVPAWRGPSFLSVLLEAAERERAEAEGQTLTLSYEFLG